MNSATSAPANPFGNGFCFQSSPSHLKRFIMFDNSGGRGRVFVHPALAHELFGSTQKQDESKGKQTIASNPSPSDESAMKIIAYRKVVASAFSSLQMLRNSRQVSLESMEQKIPTLGMCNTSSIVEETMVSGANDVADPNVGDFHVPTTTAYAHVASETLALESEPKVFATLPSAKRFRVSETSGLMEFLPFSESQYAGVKQSDSASSEGWENSEDLDALLSCDEDDEDEDDDVRSTGHSPGKSSEKGESFNENEDGGDDDDDDDEVQQKTNKRARMDKEGIRQEVETRGVIGGYAGIHEQYTKQGNATQHVQDTEQGNASLHVQDRRRKIKKKMRALRKMIPGGAFLDPAVVLHETVQYLKSLCDQVNQIESAPFPAQL